jgi:hypothetical protein
MENAYLFLESGPENSKRIVGSGGAPARAALGGPAEAGLPQPAALAPGGDSSVSSCRSYSPAKCPGTSAGTFPVALSLSGEDPRGLRRGSKGSCGTPGTRGVSSPASHLALTMFFAPSCSRAHLAHLSWDL